MANLSLILVKIILNTPNETINDSNNKNRCGEFPFIKKEDDTLLQINTGITIEKN